MSKEIYFHGDLPSPIRPGERQNYNEEKKKQEAPIYNVIADFPGNKDFPVGKRIRLHPWRSSTHYWCYIVKDCQGEREYLEDFFKQYPHLFKKIE